MVFRLDWVAVRDFGLNIKTCSNVKSDKYYIIGLIRMKAKEFIREYNRDVTKRQYAPGIVKALANSNNTFDKELYKDSIKKVGNDQGKLLDFLSQDLLSKFEDSDPTTNKLYTPWIAREYSKGNIKALEDLSRINVALSLYDKYKNKKLFVELFNKPELKDIYKLDANTLEDMGMALNKVDTKDKEDKEEKKGNAEEFYNDKDLRIIIPKDKEAACYYGQGTKWCTAATQGGNAFDQYKGSGKIYIIIPKKPLYAGEKYQFQFGTDQFMNERDQPVSNWKMSGQEFRERFPQLGKVFFNEMDLHGTGWFLLDPDRMTINDKRLILDRMDATKFDNGAYFILLNNIEDMDSDAPFRAIDGTKIRKLAAILGAVDKHEEFSFNGRDIEDWQDESNELTQLFDLEPPFGNIDFFILNPELNGGIVGCISFAYNRYNELRDRPGLTWVKSIDPVSEEAKQAFYSIKRVLPNNGKFSEIENTNSRNRIKMEVLKAFGTDNEIQQFKNYLDSQEY